MKVRLRFNVRFDDELKEKFGVSEWADLRFRDLLVLWLGGTPGRRR